MKKYGKEILFVVVMVILIGYIFWDSKRDVTYLFKGAYRSNPENLDVDVYLMKNGKGNLLTYSTNIYYLETEIKGTQFYYLKNEEKQVFLGGSRLSFSDYSKKNVNKKEYGIDYFDVILDNTDNLYFDLCRDAECKDVFRTLKLEKSKLF